MSHIGYAIDNDMGLKQFVTRVSNELLRAMSDCPDRKPETSLLKEMQTMITQAIVDDVPENFFFGEEFPYGKFLTPSELHVVIDLGRFIRALIKNRCYAEKQHWVYINMNEGFTVLVVHNA